MIVIHASFPMDPAHRDDALDLVEDLVDRSTDEDGTIDYRATTDIRDENTIRFFERYEDEAAFEAHTRTDHFRAFEAALPDLLAGEPEILRFEVDDAAELDL